MASTPTTIKTYDKFLKEWYLSNWVDQLNSMSTTLKLFRQKLVNFGGRRMVIPIRTSRNTGVGAIATTAASTSMTTLLEAGKQGVDNALVTPRLVQGALELAQDVIDTSAGDRAAFFDALDFEMAGLVQDAAEDMDRQMYGSGNGHIAKAYDAGTAATALNTTYHRPFFENMLIDIWPSEAPGGTADASGVKITDVQRNSDGSGVLTLDTAQTWLDNASIIRKGTRTATTGYEFMGIKGIVSASNPTLENLEGIDRTVTGNGFWKANEDSTTTAVSEKAIQAMVDRTHDDSNGDTQVLLMNRLGRAELYNSLNANSRRFADTNVIQPGILSGKLEDHHPEAHDFLFWDGRVPIIVDKYAPVEIDVTASTKKFSIFGLDLSSIFMALVTDWKWWDGGQGTILRPSTARAFGIEAVLYKMGNLVTDAPRKNWVMNNLNLT